MRSGAHSKENIEILHATLPGRLRLKIPRLYRDDARCRQLESALLALPGITETKANPLSSSALIRFEPERVSQAELLRKVRFALKARRAKSRQTTVMEKPAGSDWHRLPTELVAKKLRTSLSRGLSDTEARKRLENEGANLLPVLPGRSGAEVLRKQFDSLPVILLIGSAGLSVLTGGMADALVILGVVAINGYLGFLTEYSAEKTIRSLTHERGDHCTVVRNGAPKRIKASQLVPGDVLLLSPGSSVLADARLIEVSHLTVDESALTGESLPVRKKSSPLEMRYCALGDCLNLVFRGTNVTGGSGRALVFATGGKTEIGRIQTLMGESTAPETPLQRQLRHLGNQMVVYSLVLSGIVLVIGALRRYPFVHLLKTSVSLAIAAIPESLPTIATTTLAQGVRALDQSGVLVRHLDALETLGGIDVLCLDKTGTLTMNEMSVVSVSTLSGHFEASEGAFLLKSKGVSPEDFPALSELLRVISLCNEANLEEARGSATELALLKLAQQSGIAVRELRASLPALSTLYRAEGRNYMTTRHALPGGRTLQATKGRPDEVLKLCSHVSLKGEILPLTDAIRRSILKKNEELASHGLRVLGVASCEGAEKSSPTTWLGLISMADPIRPGTRAWIKKMHEAGIRTLMITGDQPRTAIHIGETLGLSGEEELRHLSASELLRLPPERRRAAARTTHLFSRVSPAQKLDIVRELREAGQVVAMIGDGINDGPALKAADVGIAMGGKGEKAATQAADLVLWEDDLNQVTRAIREGRRTQDDIKKAVDYILTQNLTEMLFALSSVALGLGEPLTPMQLLWINLVTDIFPELALALEPAEPGLLKRRPNHARDRLLGKDDFRRMALESTLLTSSVLGSYALARATHGPGAVARTRAFLTLITSSLLYTLNARSRSCRLLSRKPLPENPLISLSIGAGFAAEAVAVYIPLLSKLLGTECTGAGDFLISGAFSIAPALAIELAKAGSEPRRVA